MKGEYWNDYPDSSDSEDETSKVILKGGSKITKKVAEIKDNIRMIIKEKTKAKPKILFCGGNKKLRKHYHFPAHEDDMVEPSWVEAVSPP